MVIPGLYRASSNHKKIDPELTHHVCYGTTPFSALESQERGKDPYELMSQVMRQRVEMATQLVRDVIRDLETLDADFDTPGLPELNKAVLELAERLSKLFPHR